MYPWLVDDVDTTKDPLRDKRVIISTHHVVHRITGIAIARAQEESLDSGSARTPRGDEKGARGR